MPAKTRWKSQPSRRAKIDIYRHELTSVSLVWADFRKFPLKDLLAEVGSCSVAVDPSNAGNDEVSIPCAWPRCFTAVLILGAAWEAVCVWFLMKALTPRCRTCSAMPSLVQWRVLRDFLRAFGVPGGHLKAANHVESHRGLCGGGLPMPHGSCLDVPKSAVRSSRAVGEPKSKSSRLGKDVNVTCCARSHRDEAAEGVCHELLGGPRHRTSFGRVRALVVEAQSQRYRQRV